VTIAEQFAQLMAGVNVQAPPTAPGFKPMDQNPVAKSRTVYSVGEAVKRREQAKHAKLGASPF